SLNFDTLIEKELLGSVEAILAHEVGHHVKYPGSLAVQARLRLLERSLLPFKDYSLINLFTDLMINERLGRDLRGQLIAVYRAFTATPAFHASGKWKRDPSFLFYMAIYEELWRLTPGELMGRPAEEFGKHFNGYRAEARVLAERLFNLEPNVYTQFLYYLSISCRYLQPIVDDDPQAADPYACGCDDPNADDWADALSPNAQERAAIERAIREGWFDPDEAKRLDDLSAIEERIARLPGFGSADAHQVPEIMACWYRQQAENYLIKPPPQQRMGEAVVPTTLEDWEPGDSPRDIDWRATLTHRGDTLGPAAPIRRSCIAEVEGMEVPLWQPRIEIYLDVSGSMPDPRCCVNSMTLAAQILTLGAIRANGWVRALVYSSEPVFYWEWCRSETEISRFLMHYIGSGTQFPFAVVRRSIAECGNDQPIRVVISDTDFDRNYISYLENRRGDALLFDAAESAPFVLMQHR
ncbi:MAG: hypothetical protein QF805_29620, partial [Pirellulaceae bacterium]|nr:hypothetical protein [Pirellulaceae bacterium]